MTIYSVFAGIPRDISLVGQSWIINIGFRRHEQRQLELQQIKNIGCS